MRCLLQTKDGDIQRKCSEISTKGKTWSPVFWVDVRQVAQTRYSLEQQWECRERCFQRMEHFIFPQDTETGMYGHRNQCWSFPVECWGQNSSQKRQREAVRQTECPLWTHEGCVGQMDTMEDRQDGAVLKITSQGGKLFKQENLSN